MTATASITSLQQARESGLPASTSLAAVQRSAAVGFSDLQAFENLQRMAKPLAASALVPQQFRNNIGDCMIALDMAQRLHASPLQVMQNLYVVHGSPAWSSKFLIATINACGRYSSLRYEWKGKPGNDDYGCRAWAEEKATGQRLDGVWVTWAMVKAEGWSKKNGSKWLTMADQMFVYRAATFWQRAYAPELSMGLSTQEELQDVIDVAPDGSYTITSESIHARSVEAETIDHQTGEVAEPATDDEIEVIEAMTYAQVANRIHSASDKDTLDMARDLIRAVPDEKQQAELHQLAAKKLEAISKT
ncbi:MAG: hypothetical protein KDG56_17690 [Ottowia sp.]|nr:hypothetical protein [Ottowia sp.]